MPTGYTAPIYEDIEGFTFRDYVLRCARAFGASVRQRDQSLDVPPEVGPLDSFYARSVRHDRQRIEELETMTEAEILAAYEVQYQKDCDSLRKSIEKDRELKKRYKEFLDQAVAWKIPSPDHMEFKEFMISQLSDSIAFDCGSLDRKPPERGDPIEWHRHQLSIAKKCYEDSKRNLQDQMMKHAQAVLWLKQLYASLEAGREEDHEEGKPAE